MKEEFAHKLHRENIKTYEKIADQFDQTRQWIPPEYEKLKEYIEPEDRILDIGCGNGRFYQVVKETKAVKYQGVDVTEKLISRAQKNYPEGEFKKADALNLPFEDNRFDKVFSIATLHHIPSQKLRDRFLKESKRVLKKDGVLVATVWNLWQKKYLPLVFNFTIKKLLGKTKLDFKDVFKPWGEGDQERYYHAFTLRELKKAAQRAGFKEINTKHLKRNDKKANFLLTAKKPRRQTHSSEKTSK